MYREISIHSPLTRGDYNAIIFHVSQFISIHSPLTRGDDGYASSLGGYNQFQSTPLSRGETSAGRSCRKPGRYFNPLPSHEGRQDFPQKIVRQLLFQSTPLSRGETSLFYSSCSGFVVFQSTPLSRGETESPNHTCRSALNFNPLPSHEGRQFLSHSLHLSVKFQSTPLSRGETCSPIGS